MKKKEHVDKECSEMKSGEVEEKGRRKEEEEKKMGLT